MKKWIFFRFFSEIFSEKKFFEAWFFVSKSAISSRWIKQTWFSDWKKLRIVYEQKILFGNCKERKHEIVRENKNSWKNKISRIQNFRSEENIWHHFYGYNFEIRCVCMSGKAENVFLKKEFCFEFWWKFFFGFMKVRTALVIFKNRLNLKIFDQFGTRDQGSVQVRYPWMKKSW